MRAVFAALIFCAACACAGQPVRVSLVCAAETPTPNASVACALRFEMAEGWHIYSDTPQSAGVPPSVQWRLPEGWRAGPLGFPPARAFKAGGLESFGYADTVYLPVALTASAQVSGTETLAADIDLIACGDTCMPLVLSASLSFPQPPLPQTRADIAAAFASVAKDGGAPAEPVSENLRAPAEPNGGGSLFALLCVAFLGGLILNVMPCVFPVIALKIMGFVDHAGANARALRLHGLVFTAGALASLWALAAVLLALRAGGAQLGWGFQLQSPVFVFLLCALFLVFGLSLLGVFEVGQRLTGAGAAARGEGFGATFLSGALAVVVATPCSAPFFAPAIAAALALPPLESFALFSAVGLGLSFPYAALCCFPQLLKKLPKPGAWMLTARQIFGWLFLGTSLYLLWVLAGQTAADAYAFAAVLGALWLMGVAVWIYGKWAVISAAPRARRAAAALAAVLLGLALWLGLPAGADNAQDALHWQPYSAEALAQARAQGRPVWVDFTARWCVTCQTNKAALAASPALRTAIKEKNVALLQADWTARDESISRALAAFGRASVPLDALYLPQRAEPIILPTVLTPSDVLEALDSAQ